MTRRPRRFWGSVALAFALLAVGVGGAAGSLARGSAPAGPQREKLEMYVLEGPAAKLAEATKGLELRDVRHTEAGIRAEAVLTARQAAKIRAQGVKVELLRNAKGQTVSEQAALMAANGFDVWRSWDEPGGLRDEMREIARRNSQTTKLVVIGR